jgi:hypothetical protein
VATLRRLRASYPLAQGLSAWTKAASTNSLIIT